MKISWGALCPDCDHLRSKHGSFTVEGPWVCQERDCSCSQGRDAKWIEVTEKQYRDHRRQQREARQQGRESQ